MSTDIQRVDADLDYEPSTGIARLLEIAVQQDMDIAKIERLCDLEQKYHDRSAMQAFIKAKAAFQQECPEIKKSATANTGRFKWKYADLGPIVQQIAPVLGKYGLAFTWKLSTELNPPAVVVSCELTHELGHKEVSEFRAEVGGLDHMNKMQQNAAALTYGRRQSLIAVTGIGTSDEDTDAVGSEAPPAYINERQLNQLKKDWSCTRLDEMQGASKEGIRDKFNAWVAETLGEEWPKPYKIQWWTLQRYGVAMEKTSKEMEN